jgi:hypothetical protein
VKNYHFNENGVTVVLQDVADRDYATITETFTRLLQTVEKKRDAIADGFLAAIRRCPRANPSDLWHHVLYRQYLKLHTASNPAQSWVRAGGEALEIFVGMLYNPVLIQYGLTLVPLISREKKKDALVALGLGGSVGNSKLDIAIARKSGKGFKTVGGVHVKASLAERVSDDVPASVAMMNAGYLSVLWTLDVKSFPPPHGNLVNKGELGTPDKPSDKRRYIEQHGSFDACFSYNLRSVPSPERTASGKRIFVQNLSPQPDAFVKYLVGASGRY